MRRLLLVLLLTSVACAQPPADAHQLHGVALAGPVCPVETDPPTPGCEPRPVAGAEIEARDAGGAVVASTTTDESGEFMMSLPSGTYTIVGMEVEGLLGTPAPFEVVVDTDDVDISLDYDTGIR